MPVLQARAAAARIEHAALGFFAEAYCRIAGGPATDYGRNHGFVLARVAAFLEGRGSGCWEWNVAEDYHETLVELHAEAAVAIELQNSAEDPDWPALPEINLELSQVRYGGHCHDATFEASRLAKLLVQLSAGSFCRPPKLS